MTYESYQLKHSANYPGVSFLVNRMSFGRRLELLRRIREVLPRLEFVQAGKSTGERIEANLLSGEIDRLYVEWGLSEIRGLEIDGKPADATSLAQTGPESLFVEAVRFVKEACHLSETDAKN